MTNTETCVDAIRDYLLEKYAPEAILLHGSRARDDAAGSSDYDIAIITFKTERIHPHEYEGMMLDISAYPDTTQILVTGNKVPNWPLKILYDANGVGDRICSATEQAYKNGSPPLSAQEWNNRTNYTKRLIAKIEARGHDISVRRYYMADFYVRAIRYWFEKQSRWTVSPYRALPIIQTDDAAFFVALQNLWTDSYRSALHQINRALFDERSQVE